VPAEALLRFAAYAGAHALLLYFALLAGLLLFLAAGWRLIHVCVLPQARRQGPQAIKILKGAGGLLTAVGAATLFALIAYALTRNGLMSRADEALSAALGQHVSAATVGVFAALTHLGDTLVRICLGAAVGLLLWHSGRHELTAGLLIAVGGVILLNPMLKLMFERVRPVYENAMVTELGWSFPSGHTSGATVTYGMLAYIAVRVLPAVWHLPAVLGAAALAFTVGCSRIFLRVHFASDVAAGFALGIAWLAVCILGVELSRRLSHRN
jgi:membrane-associated phospholipid phosphatase